MSRQPAPRTLSLTEELEKLEQSITLTLQEIDSNFNKAHRIVTSSILPIVEQYAKHSNDVWEGSKFWKQFFEASANVSLSGYEEATMDEDTFHTETTSTDLETPTDRGEHTPKRTPTKAPEDDSWLDDSPTQMTGAQSTPKLSPSSVKKMGGRSELSKSSEALRSPSPRKYTGKNPIAMEDAQDAPSTPRAQPVFNPQSSPFEPESAYQPSARGLRASNDPIMHRGVLDKNYRIQATPHTQRRTRPAVASNPTPATATRRALWEDSPQSSPEMAAPQLRSDLFSPAKTGPRTPGVSVLTPGRKTGRAAPTTSTGRQLFSPDDKAYSSARNRASYGFSHADDDDLDYEDTDTLGMSPPKTLQFHVPQSRLMQTPAREASKRIVEDLLLTAGADATDEIEDDDDLDFGDEEASPSVVRRAFDDDDTF